MANYVKFVRGLTSVFEKLTTKNADTLYFIYDDETSKSGRLYLGDREIVCNGGSEGSGATFLKDLLDVALPVDKSELIDGQVLTYDAATDKWVARDPSTIATVLFDTNQFETNENGEWSLLDFANAPSGARLTKGADGKLIWDLPDDATNEDLAEQIELLRTDVNDLTTKFNDYDTSAQVDSKISEAVAAANHLSYKTVDTIGDIDLTETQYIYLVKNGEVYDEYMVVNGKLEKVGDWNVDLSNYATKSEVQAVDTKVEELGTSIAEQISIIESTLETIEIQIEELGTINSQVEDLVQEVNNISTTVTEHSTQIEELKNALDNKVDRDEFDEFKTAMSWKTLSED